MRSRTTPSSVTAVTVASHVRAYASTENSSSVTRKSVSNASNDPGYERTETSCAPGKVFSPARIETVTQFSPGGIGQDQFGLYAHDGL